MKRSAMDWRRMSFDERLAEQIEPEPMSGCWLWSGAVQGPWPYGALNYGGKVQRAHRVVYERHRGPIPEGLVLDHLCRNPSCVNPDHLEPVTQHVNCLRGEKATKTHCVAGHPLSGENLRIIQGCRRCKACEYRRNKERYARGGREKRRERWRLLGR